MSTTSLFFHATGGESTGEFQRLDNGGAVVLNKRVFRAGKFRDSRGKMREWTAEDLETMVSNFSALHDVLPHVPVRRDHTRSVSNIMGYYTGLRTDGQYLFADYHITEPSDAEKYERGTYRNVSIEIGTYTTNDEETHAPVVMGLAYVDLPAVEGLFTLHQEDDAMSFTQEELDWAVAATYAAAVEETTEFALAAGYAQGELDVRAEFAADEDNDRPPFKFALSDGTETTDYAKVQADLTAMSTVLAEQRDLFRHAFVNQLVEDGKIIAPMADSLKEHVSNLSDDQYASFAATYEQAPRVGILGDHGGEETDPGKGDEFSAEVERLEQQLEFHRMSGLKDDQIKTLESFARLQEIRTLQAQEV